MTDMPDDLADLTVPELLDLQHQLGADRQEALDRQRQVQAELDERVARAEAARVEEAKLLGQAERPQTQYVMGGPNDG